MTAGDRDGMLSQDSQKIANQAEVVYEQHLKTTLERSHPGAFVAIEPVSGDHFLGRTLSEAIGAARQAHPQHLSYVIRIGHKTAVHIGTCLS